MHYRIILCILITVPDVDELFFEVLKGVQNLRIEVRRTLLDNNFSRLIMRECLLVHPF